VAMGVLFLLLSALALTRVDPHRREDVESLTGDAAPGPVRAPSAGAAAT